VILNLASSNLTTGTGIKKVIAKQASDSITIVEQATYDLKFKSLNPAAPGTDTKW
jgi:hypothetical protein